ncbi:MAG TPA: hypothetical protein DCY71_09770, partial [Clostridiaceae bacterium]|nr:hypothetical protein [Clostridiaceae bacterium]
KYGRCNRQNACRYHLYPKLGKDDINSSRYVPPTPEEIKPLDFVDKDLMQATFNEFKSNVFFMYLVKLFGIEKAYQLQEAYNIGTARGGGVIFWQQDRELNIRTGKVMYYNANGRRNKDKMSWFVHKKISKDFNYRQCFFGLHLTSLDKPVALCESEKTAIIMSVFEPGYTWIASGGSEMLNTERLLELPRLDMVYPDQSPELFKKWEKQTSIFTNRQMDVSVEKAYKDGIVEAGADILDLELIQRGFR